jgi:hypothetical protein
MAQCNSVPPSVELVSSCLATFGEGVMRAFRYDFLGGFSDKLTFDNEYLN